VNGKPLWFVQNVASVTVDSGVGQVIIINSSAITVTSQTLLSIHIYFSTDVQITTNNITNNHLGIYAYYSTNLTITENSINNTYYGILLHKTHNTTISSNTINYAYFGVSLHYSLNNDIVTNNLDATYYGISAEYSDYNTIAGNVKLDYKNYSHYIGIELLMSYNNSVTGNTLRNNTYGFYLSTSANNTFSDNTLTWNYEVDIYVSYSSFNNITANVMDKNYYGVGLYLYVAYNNTIWDNSVTHNREGIYLDRSNYNTISDNLLEANNYGIVLEDSRFNTLKLNIVFNNTVNGIRVRSSYFNNITHNTLEENKNFAISLEGATYNNITWNDFINNYMEGSSQAYDNRGSDNHFLFNFWTDHLSPDSDEDGISDYPYAIAGEGLNQDLTPLTGPVTVPDIFAPHIDISSPESKYYDTNNVLLVYFISEKGTIEVYVDGDVNGGLVPESWLEDLSEGQHNVTIIAVDMVGNEGKAEVLFSVDTVIPIVTISNPTSGTYGTDVLLTYSISEAGTVEIYLDGSANRTTMESGTILTKLLDGDHYLEIKVTDIAGNVGNVIVIFTVDATAPTITITSPGDMTMYDSSTIQLTYSISERATVTIFLDGMQNTTMWNSGYMFTVDTDLIDILHNITILAVDAYGNVATFTVFFIVEPGYTKSTESTDKASGFKSVFVLLSLGMIGIIILIRRKIE
jgi:parallel beta-helix repeat protein